MGGKPRRRTNAFVLSVLVGAFAGITLQSLVTLADEPPPLAEWWAIPVIIFGYGILAVPFVALGLAIFGLPATRLLRSEAQSWWLGIVAAIWGAVAGKLMFYAIDHLIFMGFYDFGKVALTDLGVLYGVPTGLAWWAFRRRELAMR
jgi:hypothetical protein